MLENDWKDALRQTVSSLKCFMAKHWRAMAEGDIEAVMKSVHDPGCLFLWQHLTPEGVDVTEPRTKIPLAWEFLRQLLEKKRKTEVGELITMAFDHLSEAHRHIITYC